MRTLFRLPTKKSIAQSATLAFILLAGSLANAAIKDKIEASQYEKISITKVKFSKHIDEAISKDTPILKTSFLGNNSLIFAGQRNLWFYNIESKALKKVGFKDSVTKAMITPVSKTKLIVARDNQLLAITTAPRLSVKKVPLSQNNETILKVGIHRNIATVITTTGVYALKQDKTLKKISDLVEIPRSAEEIMIGSEYIWLYSKYDVWKWDVHAASIRKVAKNIKTIQNLVSSEDRLLIQTRYSLIVIDKDGNIDQTIPVSSTRKLVQFNISDQYHTFLFDDKQLEIYSSNGSKIKYTKLPVKMTKKVDKLNFRKGQLLSVLDGRLALFRLEGVWK